MTINQIKTFYDLHDFVNDIIKKLEYLITKIDIIEEDINNLFEMQIDNAKIIETLLKQARLFEEDLK